MVLSPERLVIPLERISYVTTQSLDKKELLQWIHISGRRDLTAVFEKDYPTSSIIRSEKQTFLKIKQGIKAVVSRVVDISYNIS